MGGWKPPVTLLTVYQQRDMEGPAGVLGWKLEVETALSRWPADT